MGLIATGALTMLGRVSCFAGSGPAPTYSMAPSTMARIGSIDERFQSYNIEMVEVTGGRFWKPYASKAEATPAASKQPSSNQPAGMDPGLYQYRQPINLANPRLRKLAAALGPAYLRVSGTWANTTYFQNSDEPAPAAPPKGFNGVLTRQQWKGVVDFSHAANAEIVTSFAVSPGTRDSAGVWTPEQARQFLDYTKSAGGHIAAAEYMNEPNIAELGGAPKGYSAADYGRDVAAFRAFAKQAAPDMIFLGPGSAGEGTLMTPSSMHTLSSADLFTATGPVFDAVSYHSYGGVSSRCSTFGAASQQPLLPLYPTSGSLARTRSKASMAASAIDSSLANPSGSPRRRRPHAGEIAGLPHSSIPSAISISWAFWPGAASRSICTTPSPQATMLYSTRTPTSHGPTIGQRCSGESSWELWFSIPALCPHRISMSTHSACAIILAALLFW